MNVDRIKELAKEGISEIVCQIKMNQKILGFIYKFERLHGEIFIYQF